MTIKKNSNKRSSFALTPISLTNPVKATDGFTNLIETSTDEKDVANKESPNIDLNSSSSNVEFNEEQPSKSGNSSIDQKRKDNGKASDEKNESSGKKVATEMRLSKDELLRILDAESLDEIYELSDVLRASSLKLYASLVNLSDSRGRIRIKNHELMTKTGIKGIATLYKQERWLIDLKLLEKKAKPGPHDGSSYVVHDLESLPLPNEIHEKFKNYLSKFK